MPKTVKRRWIETQVWLPEDLIKWVDSLVERRVFPSRGFAIHYAMTLLKEDIEKGEIKLVQKYRRSGASQQGSDELPSL